MWRRIGILFVALALFAIAGGHWAVVQSVAWAEMLRDYTQRTGSVAVAIEQTFDGQHPCALCRQIQTAKAQEHQESPAVPGAKEDAPLKAVSTDPFIRPAERLAAKLVFQRTDVIFRAGWTEAPPTPPPRPAVVAA